MNTLNIVPLPVGSSSVLHEMSHPPIFVVMPIEPVSWSHMIKLHVLSVAAATVAHFNVPPTLRDSLPSP